MDEDADAEMVVEAKTRSRRDAAHPHRLATAWHRLVAYLFQPEDGECLAALRMAFSECSRT
jgi:hypothetical protein